MRLKAGLAAAAATIAVLALPASAAAGRTLYVTNSGTSDTGLAAFAAVADGTTAPVAGTPVEAGDDPTGVAVTPDARYAYVTNLGDDTIGIYKLSAKGVPTELGTVPTGNQPTGIGITPDGEFLYVTNRDGTNTAPSVSGFAIDESDGSLTALPGSPFDFGVFDPRAAIVSPDGRFLYVSARRGPSGPPVSNADRALVVASIGANGVPTQIGGSPFYGTPTNPFAMSITPDGSRLFLTALTPDDIEVFDLNPSTGAPSAVTGSPFNSGESPIVLATTPDGNRLYVGLAGTGEAVQGFNVNPATGALSSIGGTPLAAGGDPNGIAITPDGDTVYSSLLANPGTFSAMRIAANGGLSALTGSPFPTGGEFPSFFSSAITPTQTPTNDVEVDVGPAGKTTEFDASGTKVRGGFATRYDWDFGDGSTDADGGPDTSHDYNAPGKYDVTLTVTNDCNPNADFTAGVVSTGNAIFCNGSPRTTTVTKVKIPKDKVDGSASARKKQKQKGKKILVKVKVKAGEELIAVASGKVKADGKSYGLGKVTRNVEPKAIKLKLKPKSKGKRAKIVKALKRGAKVKAKIKVKLTDDVGHKKTVKLGVRLKR